MGKCLLSNLCGRRNLHERTSKEKSELTHLNLPINININIIEHPPSQRGGKIKTFIFSGTHGDRGISIFSVQLTTSRIGNLTRLIHTLLYMTTIHTYVRILLLPGIKILI